MKFVKRISLFFVYPFVTFLIGVFVGILFMNYFYPGLATKERNKENTTDYRNMVQEEFFAEVPYEGSVSGGDGMIAKEQVVEVSGTDETLCVDTEYVLEETDVLRETVVETVWELPGKYIGMDREQFMTAMEEYQAYPPLSELERGFVGLEVLAFSRERVVVQMNYQYVQPSDSFYLAVLDHEVVVLLEDKETIYINTGIVLETLPEEVQLAIIQMLYMENEESLYDFLEGYSS